MDIQEYLSKLNSESQDVFNKTILEKEKLGSLHHMSSCLYEFANCILDPEEKAMLHTVSSQLESALLSLTLGLYRQAYSSLRLAFEMGLASIYFSANKMDLHEWLSGRADIRWARLNDEESGVLSARFARAFFGDLEDEASEYRNKAATIYRKLSEYVHGNNDTWEHSGVRLIYKQKLLEDYCTCQKQVVEIVLFCAICRYTKLFDETVRETLQFIPEEFSHITSIRTLFGRS